MDRFWSKVDKSSGDCWVWTRGLDDAGYGQFKFQGKNIKAHRVAFFLEYDYWPDQCRHSCDNPSCVRPEHLSDGTNKDNVDDMYSRERNFGLTASQVREIRNIPMSRTIISDVAEEYGITEQTARNVLDGRVWSRLPGARKVVHQKYRSKLSIQDILEIKEALKTPYWGQVNALAERYGVRHSHISRIKHGVVHGDVSTD